MPKTEAQVTTQFAPLLSGRHFGTHPLRHVLLIAWLFDSFSRFLEAYDACERTPSHTEDEHRQASLKVSDRPRGRLVDLVQSQGMSVSKAAGTLGIDPSTAMAWMAAERIESPRRAKALKPGQSVRH